MKVGIDARTLSQPLTGIGRTVVEMASALFELGDVTLYLYSCCPFRGDSLSRFPYAIKRSGEWNGLIRKQLWVESGLPLWMRKDDVDVFWGPQHRIPVLTPRHVARVVTIHDLVWKHASETVSPRFQWLDRGQTAIAVRKADRIVAISQATADDITNEYRIDTEKLRVVPLGVSVTGQAASKIMLQPMGIDRPYILAVGTVEPRKNYERLIEAYARLPDLLKDGTMLVIAGGKGWRDVDIACVVSRLGLESHVAELGYVDNHVLATLYQHARLLAMPALYEGFGLPLVEAMARGVPVLTSNCSSMPEVAGDAGLLINPHDVDSIRKGLERLLTDDVLRNQLASNAKRIASRFAWDRAAEQMLTVFKEAVSARGNAQRRG